MLKIKKETNRKITVYTDGACSPNPGKGGWGAVVIENGEIIEEFSQGFLDTTNNRMELMGPTQVLTIYKNEGWILDCEIVSDSQYLVNAFNKNWVDNWQRHDWMLKNQKTKKWQPVKNIDLWKQMIDLVDYHQVKFTWVKGHNNNPYNERADELAVAAIHEL